MSTATYPRVTIDTNYINDRYITSYTPTITYISTGTNTLNSDKKSINLTDEELDYKIESVVRRIIDNAILQERYRDNNPGEFHRKLENALMQDPRVTKLIFDCVKNQAVKNNDFLLTATTTINSLPTITVRPIRVNI
jgi:ribosomal protein L5